MASYSMGEIARMQADAESRVRNMAQRSKMLTEESDSANTAIPPQPNRQSGREQTYYQASNQTRREPPYIPPQPSPPPQPPPPGNHKPGSGFLSFLPFDLPFDLSGDRLLILLIIFMLYGDGSDRLLMIALIYLAL